MLKAEEIRDLVTCKFTYKKLIGYCASERRMWARPSLEPA